MTIRVALADDHRMLRESLRGMLTVEDGFEEIGEAGDGQSAVDIVEREAPDVLVLDIHMPGLNGIEVARKLRSRRSPVKLLALTAHDDKRFGQEMLKAGATGYVAKTSAAAKLAQAIRAVARGLSYLSPETASQLIKEVALHPLRGPPGAHCLGPRKREVLRLIADGYR